MENSQLCAACVKRQCHNISRPDSSDNVHSSYAETTTDQLCNGVIVEVVLQTERADKLQPRFFFYYLNMFLIIPIFLKKRHFTSVTAFSCTQTSMSGAVMLNSSRWTDLRPSTFLHLKGLMNTNFPIQTSHTSYMSSAATTIWEAFILEAICGG